MDSASHSVPAPASRLPLRAYAGGWAVLATVYAALYAANGVALGMSVRSALAMVLPSALLGLVSLRLARRWPWPAGGGWRVVARVAPALLGLALASTAGWLLLIGLDGKLVTGTTRWPTATIAVWQTVINGLIHFALIGIGYAWQTAEALREAREKAARAD